jgi:hypothetical protein
VDDPELKEDLRSQAQFYNRMCRSYETRFNPPLSGDAAKEKYLKVLEVFNEDMVELWDGITTDPHYPGKCDKILRILLLDPLLVLRQQ